MCGVPHKKIWIEILLRSLTITIIVVIYTKKLLYSLQFLAQFNSLVNDIFLIGIWMEIDWNCRDETSEWEGERIKKVHVIKMNRWHMEILFLLCVCMMMIRMRIFVYFLLWKFFLFIFFNCHKGSEHISVLDWMILNL